MTMARFNLLCALLFLLALTASEVDQRNVFTLRSAFNHGIERNQTILIQQSISHEESIRGGDISQLRIKMRPINIQRLADRRPSNIEPLLATARQNTELGVWSTHEWVVDEVLAPDVTDRDTVINFALMAANAYTLVPGTNDWENLDEQFGFNTSLDFGWNSNGLRGHIYADEKNTTVIIGIKGTSRALYDGDETTTSDKENDNLYFSCCCAQQGQWTWRQVCNCATDTYTCNSTCLVGNMREDHRFYQAARFLYSNVTEMYPNANVWVTGHSLGGAVSSLLGLTYGLPTITFEAPGDALPASRLGIPSPPGASYARKMTGTYHFGHTADPVFMGTCTGVSATCSFYGYAFESQCHAGMMCTYDTVGDHGWRVGIWTHGIREVIKSVLRAYDELPECIVDDQCQDCFNWKYYESNSSETTTSSSSISTRTRTRTETCETPGWWGCNDEKTSTTTSTTTTTTQTSSSTSTCKTPGWFWCKDKTSTTESSTSTTNIAPHFNPMPSTTPASANPSATGVSSNIPKGNLLAQYEL